MSDVDLLSGLPEASRGIKVPSKATLAKYGLSAEEWVEVLKRQGGVCPICGQVPTTGRMVTDHTHIRGWKKLPPELRKLYVRGVTCWWCNSTHLGRGITVQKALNTAAYLRAYEERAPKKEKPDGR